MAPSIADSMTEQHRAIDVGLAAAANHLDGGELVAAEVALAALATALRRHIAIEELHLFPAFESLPEADLALAAEMRAQHRAIEALIDAMTAATKHGDRGAALRHKAALHAALGVHDDEEEAICTALDAGLDASAGARLIVALRP